jgi:hypothetical protein
LEKHPVRRVGGAEGAAEIVLRNSRQNSLIFAPFLSIRTSARGYAIAAEKRKIERSSGVALRMSQRQFCKISKLSGLALEYFAATGDKQWRENHSRKRKPEENPKI